MSEKLEFLKEDKIKSSKKEDNVIKTSFFETPDYIFEEIKAKEAGQAGQAVQELGGLCFIKFDKKTEKVEYVTEFEFNNKVYRPIDDNIIFKNIIYLPTGIEEYGTTEKLAKTITDLFFYNFEVKESDEKLLLYYPFLTWISDKWPFVPYLSFLGGTSTGKSTAAETVGLICYKPIDAAGTSSVASIFRMADQWKGTLMLDEFSVGAFGKEAYGELLALLKVGVSNKAVLRIEGDKNKQLVGYFAKCPKIFTSEKPINEAGLQSRIITINMKKRKRRIPLFKLPKFYEESEHIRNKMLLWRLRNLSKINLENIEFGFPELEIFDPRVQQVLTPIFYLADDKTRKELVGFAKQQEEETLQERRDSLEGRIFEYIYDNKDGLIDITIPTIIETLKLDMRGQQVAKLIRKIFSLEVRPIGKEKVSTIILEDKKEQIDELAVYYGLLNNNKNKITRLIPNPPDPPNPQIEANNREKDVVKVAKEIFEKTEEIPF